MKDDNISWLISPLHDPAFGTTLGSFCVSPQETTGKAPGDGIASAPASPTDFITNTRIVGFITIRPRFVIYSQGAYKSLHIHHHHPNDQGHSLFSSTRSRLARCIISSAQRILLFTRLSALTATRLQPYARRNGRGRYHLDQHQLDCRGKNQVSHHMEACRSPAGAPFGLSTVSNDTNRDLRTKSAPREIQWLRQQYSLGREAREAERGSSRGIITGVRSLVDHLKKRSPRVFQSESMMEKR